jgi:hypothetical protein
MLLGLLPISRLGRDLKVATAATAVQGGSTAVYFRSPTPDQMFGLDSVAQCIHGQPVIAPIRNGFVLGL